MADSEPVAPIAWFQTAEGNVAPAVVPPWENAKSRRRARRHPAERRDVADINGPIAEAEQTNKGT